MFSITKNSADLDLWHRMAVGKIFSQVNNVIYHDIFSYFPTKALWVDHEWLSGVVFYNIGHYLGDYGITSLKVLMMFSVIFLIYKTNKLIYPEADKQRIFYYIVTLLAVSLGLTSTLRCQAFTYLFFTLWIYILERIRRGENRLIWIFPATTLIWANLHAGFLAGFGLIVFYIVGETLNKKNPLKYIGILLLCLPFSFINPYGIKYWTYLIEATTMHRPYIEEWDPLRPFESTFKVIGTKIQMLLLIPALVYRAATKDKKVDWVEIITFCATLYLSIKHYRHIIFFSIVAGVFGYKYFVQFLEFVKEKINQKFTFSISQERLNQLYFARYIAVYGFFIGVCCIVIAGTPKTIDLEGYPVKAVEFIKTNKIEGNLLVPFNWGSYAMWKLYPQNLVSIDGRYEECYTNQSYLDASAITLYHKNWKQAFEKYHHDVLLIYNNDSTDKEIKKSKDWKIIYQDKKSLVFVPSNYPDKKWILPPKDNDFYIKTKYENNIKF
jgi:hypothetical protein